MMQYQERGGKQLNTKIDQLYRSFDFVQVTDIVSDSINLLKDIFRKSTDRPS